MSFLLLIWLALFAGLLVILMRDRHGAGALSLSYFASLALIHVPGALTYVFQPVGNSETQDGLEVAVLGVIAFVLGVGFARLRASRMLGDERLPPLDPEWLETVARKFLLMGVFAFFIAVPIVAAVRSMTAVVSGLVGLIVIGIWLWLAAALIHRDRRKVITVLALLPLLPFATLTFSGFVSFSTQWIITIAAFFFLMSRRRLWMLVVLPFALYLSLSLFVAYLGERSAIRDLVWEEEADISARVDRIMNIFTNFEFLDITDEKHVVALDARLNQNALVGAAVATIESGSAEYAYGSTVPYWVLIPRAIWPDKPEIGGGGTLVSEYTGITFAEGTSVGAGQVLEFFVNFGRVGVAIGFFTWGFMLMTIDQKIMTAVARADMPTLLRWSMVGLTLIAPGGNLLEIVVAAAGALVAAPFILYVDRRLQSMPAAVRLAQFKTLSARRAG